MFFKILRVIIWGLISAIAVFRLSGQNILVKIKPASNVHAIEFSVLMPNTVILQGESYPEVVYRPKLEEVIRISTYGELVLLTSGESIIGYFEKVTFFTSDSGGTFLIKVHGENYSYPDELIVSSNGTELVLYNRIFIENYLPGVIAAEAGLYMNPNFQQVQAVCSRTYLYKNLEKHSEEGFDVCDKTHCQAYRDITYKHKHYIEAVQKTQGLIIVNEKNQLIDAVFCANCGGKTANSEDVWANEISYLRSTDDLSNCRGTNNSEWSKVMHKKKFYGALSNYYDITINKFSVVRDISGRIKLLLMNQDEKLVITGEQLRRLFSLKSSKMTIEIDDQFVHFQGKGFGHGVGMCQDGAQTLGKKGWDFKKIIKHYYRNVEIIPVDLGKFK